MERQREASGTLDWRTINALNQPKNLRSGFTTVPAMPGALARPLNEDHGMSCYEEYFDSLKEGEEAMSEAEYNECLAPKNIQFNQLLN